MADEFENMAQSPTTPTEFMFEVTPDDATDLERVTKAIHLNELGDVRITTKDMAEGSSVTLRNIPVGVPYPVRAKRIWQSGTTSADVVGLA
ncbi:MAG: hypothetical protein AAFY51_01830 [Pseudomonadota bacterium]